MADLIRNCVSERCCNCWVEGCGLNGMFGFLADGLECISPAFEQVASCIWIFGSPLAFPIIFCFPSVPHTNKSSGYEVSMLEAPMKRPCLCCFYTICFPCGQYHIRRAVLNYDMTKYKLWQGQHDGPHCMARYCDGAPITIKSGTYGEQDCPNIFLCLEVTVLGCWFSPCCAFDVSRRYQRDERGLSIDPTEQRFVSCISFFSRIMHYCFMLGCCVGVSSCCVGICAPGSEGAQECSGDGGRAARACCQIAAILWRGIMWTRVIGIGCMTTQMMVESETPYDKSTQGPKRKPEFLIEAPTIQTMDDRDDDHNEIQDMKFPWDKKENNNNNHNNDNANHNADHNANHNANNNNNHNNNKNKNNKNKNNKKNNTNNNNNNANTNNNDN